MKAGPVGPAIRCRIGQAEDPPDVKGKWFVEVSIHMSPEDKTPGVTLVGPFDTEAMAAEASRKAAKVACDSVCEFFGHEPSGLYYDMKDGGKLKQFETEH